MVLPNPMWHSDTLNLKWSVILTLDFLSFQCSLTITFFIARWLFVLFLFISWAIWYIKSIVRIQHNIIIMMQQTSLASSWKRCGKQALVWLNLIIPNASKSALQDWFNSNVYDNHKETVALIQNKSLPQNLGCALNPQLDLNHSLDNIPSACTKTLISVELSKVWFTKPGKQRFVFSQNLSWFNPFSNTSLAGT